MTTINDLVVSNSFAPDDKVPMWCNVNGVTRGLPLSVLTGSFLTQDDIALFAASASVETFTAGVDFTPGVSITLNLAHTYLSAQNIAVHFDAAFQGPDQFSLVLQTLTFTSPIPVGVNKVYVSGGATRVIGAPSDGTVVTSSFAAGAVSTKLSNELISQVGGGQFFAQNGAKIHRFNDRVFIGDSALADGRFPPNQADWFSAYQAALGYGTSALPFGTLAVSTGNNAANGGIAGVFSAQSKQFTSAGTSCIPIEAFAINNNTTLATTAWAYYGEAHRVNSTVGAAICMEVDTYNAVDSTTPHPYTQGNSIGYQIGSGAGVQGVEFTGSISGTTLTVSSVQFQEVGPGIAPGQIIYGVGVTGATTIVQQLTGTTGGVGTYQVNNSQSVTSRYMVSTIQYDSSAAIQIVNNPTKWKVGINFTSTSLAGCDGVNGQGTALALAKGHQLVWYNSSALVTSAIVSNVTNQVNGTGIQFTDSGLQINSTAGPPIAFFFPVASSVNYLQFAPSVTGAAVSIGAGGTDTNVDILLNPKGSGAVSFGSYTAGTFAQTGYITIKDSSGNFRRLMVG